jgi:alkylation response protein AidB-like acyl-CoA dehydrogenase
MAMSDLEMALTLEEAGRAALPLPLLETAAVAAPLLGELGNTELAAAWLPRVARGEATVAVCFSPEREGPALINHAPMASVFLIERDKAVYVAAPSEVTLCHAVSVDGARRLATVDYTPHASTRSVSGPQVELAMDRAFNRGALGCAAEALGVAAALLEMTVGFVKDRHQFGQPVGAFQAVKHRLANALVSVEMARPAVYRAATTVGEHRGGENVHVSLAKILACEAVNATAQAALQCHGAMGYSFEYDLHLWLKRAFALTHAWGSLPWHRRRMAAA